MDNSSALPRHRGPIRLTLGSLLLFVITLPLAVSTNVIGFTSEVSHGLRDETWLHEIGIAWLILAEQNHGTTPPAALVDVYSVATELARSEGVTDAKYWFSSVEQIDGLWQPLADTVLAPDGSKAINPAFRGAPVAWCAALISTNLWQLPPTTPMAWTRGLKPDGTWREDSPDFPAGGCVFFVGGTVQFFHDKIDGRLVKWGTTNDATSDIMEALPPGTRISEYVPNPRGAALTRRYWWWGESESWSQTLGIPILLVAVASALGAGRGAWVGATDRNLGRPARILYGLAGLPVAAVLVLLAFRFALVGMLQG
jgi:hypothetical protein